MSSIDYKIKKDKCGEMCTVSITQLVYYVGKGYNLSLTHHIK
jgi:hypothetical protein